MGNALLRGIVHRHGSRIKIMKADGTVMKLRSPVSVKEILIDYPNHGIFEAPAAGPRLGIGCFTIPLPGRAGLIAGHLYYLIPLPLQQDEHINCNNNTNGWPFARTSSHHSIPTASGSRVLPPSCSGIGMRDSIKQEAADSEMNRGGVTIVSSSYSNDGSSMRVKLRLRKEELASFLSANNVKVMVPPLIQGALTRQSPWKPRLDTIAEPKSPLGDLY